MENPLHRFMLVWLSVRYFVSQISDEKDSEMDKYKKSALIAAIIFVFWTIARRRVPATGPPPRPRGRAPRRIRAAIPFERRAATARATPPPGLASRRRAQVRTLNASQARYEQEQHKEERAAVELAMKADAEQKAAKEKKKDK